jgi:uncharacterized protein YneF (UPF0154 family)
MIIINLPTYLFLLLVILVLVAGIVIGISLTSWIIRKEIEKLARSKPPKKAG